MMSRTRRRRGARALRDARAHRGQRAIERGAFVCDARAGFANSDLVRLQIEAVPTAKPRLAITPRSWPGSVAPPTAARAARRCRRGMAAAGSSSRMTLRNLGDAGGGRRLEADDDEFITAAHTERHQRHGAARIRAAATRADLDS